jgi:hypothetical protein
MTERQLSDSLHEATAYLKSNGQDSQIEAALVPLEDFMSRLLILVRERGPEWCRQTPPHRTESILQALQQL